MIIFLILTIKKLITSSRLMMLDFSIGTGPENEGVVGLDQDCWRMPDRLGRVRIAVMPIFRLCWRLLSAKTRETKGVGEGLARSRSDA